MTNIHCKPETVSKYTFPVMHFTQGFEGQDKKYQ